MKISRHLIYRLRWLTLLLNSSWHRTNRSWVKVELNKITQQIRDEQLNQRDYIVGTVRKTVTEEIDEELKNIIINTTKNVITDDDGNVTEEIIKVIRKELWKDGLTTKYIVTDDEKVTVDYDSKNITDNVITSMDSEYSLDGHTGTEVTIEFKYSDNEKVTTTKRTVPDAEEELGHRDIITMEIIILEPNAYVKKIPLVPIVVVVQEDLTEQLSVDPTLLTQLESIDEFLDEDNSEKIASDEVVLSKLNVVVDSTGDKVVTSKVSKMADSVNMSGSTITFQGLQTTDGMLQMVSAEDEDIIDINDYNFYWFTRMNVQLINGHIIIKT